MYFFGVGPGINAGHYLYNDSYVRIKAEDLPKCFEPWDLDSDTRYPPPGKYDVRVGCIPNNYQIQGHGKLHHICVPDLTLKVDILLPGEPLPPPVYKDDRWTLLSIWDRSGDTRYASRAVFLEKGYFTGPDFLTKIEHDFPELFRRIGKINIQP